MVTITLKLKTVFGAELKFHLVIDIQTSKVDCPYWLKTLIYLGVTSSQVKVTITFKLKTVSGA
jgi:hypothetical protein